MHILLTGTPINKAQLKLLPMAQNLFQHASVLNKKWLREYIKVSWVSSAWTSTLQYCMQTFTCVKQPCLFIVTVKLLPFRTSCYIFVFDLAFLLAFLVVLVLLQKFASFAVYALLAKWYCNLWWQRLNNISILISTYFDSAAFYYIYVFDLL